MLDLIIIYEISVNTTHCVKNESRHDFTLFIQPFYELGSDGTIEV